MKTALAKAGRIAKAIAGAVLPFVVISLEQDRVNWKAILAAAVTALGVFLAPNFNQEPAK